MSNVVNEAGEVVFRGSSDAECVRWWEDSGRPGDYLDDTGELLSKVADQIGRSSDCNCALGSSFGCPVHDPSNAPIEEGTTAT